MQTPTLGTVVRISGYVAPKKVRDNFTTHRRIVRVPFTAEGIYVGTRSLREGDICHDTENGLEFTPTAYVTVYLIAINKRKLLRCLPVDVQVIKKAPQSSQETGNSWYTT